MLVDVPAEHGVKATFFRRLCTGRAPVLSTTSAYALEVLSGRRLAQLQLLEGLLRRHARHRPILFVVVDASELASDAAWMLHHLPALLLDSAVTWLYFESVDRTQSNGNAPRGRADRAQFGWKSLTETETKVARLIAEGHTNRSAAAELFVSVNTISTHLRSVFSKLDVNSRVQLTRQVLECLPAEQQPTTTRCPHP
jgi:DNA-binding CsgD family transcriptional regulator